MQKVYHVLIIPLILFLYLHSQEFTYLNPIFLKIILIYKLFYLQAKITFLKSQVFQTQQQQNFIICTNIRIFLHHKNIVKHFHKEHSNNFLCVNYYFFLIKILIFRNHHFNQI